MDKSPYQELLEEANALDVQLDPLIENTCQCPTCTIVRDTATKAKTFVKECRGMLSDLIVVEPGGADLRTGELLGAVRALSAISDTFVDLIEAAHTTFKDILKKGVVASVELDGLGPDLNSVARTIAEKIRESIENLSDDDEPEPITTIRDPNANYDPNAN